MRNRWLLLMLVFFLLTPTVYAKNESMVFDTLKDSEMQEMKEGLSKWKNDKTIETLSSTLPLTDDKVKNMYKEFIDTLIVPPNPDIKEVLDVQHAKICMDSSNELGRTFHNYLFAMSDDEVNKYGKLFQIMRDVLYLDWKHVPLAIKGDNSRDAYWYGLHNKWLKKAEDEYNRLFVEQAVNLDQQTAIRRIMENENAWSYDTKMVDLNNDGFKKAIITYAYGTHHSGIKVIEFSNNQANVIFEETCSTPNAKFDVIDNTPTLIFEESNYAPDYATGNTYNKIYKWDGKTFVLHTTQDEANFSKSDTCLQTKERTYP